MVKYRPGVCAVVWRKKKDGMEVLLLHRHLNWVGWELPKGGMLPGETEEDCLLRELREEVGIENPKYEKLDYILQYKWSRPLPKDGDTWEGVRLMLYSVEHDGSPVRIDEREHSGYAWVSPEEALKRLTYDDQKEALKFFLFLKEDQICGRKPR